jgi:hypothetical protein
VPDGCIISVSAGRQLVEGNRVIGELHSILAGGALAPSDVQLAPDTVAEISGVAPENLADIVRNNKAILRTVQARRPGEPFRGWKCVACLTENQYFSDLYRASSAWL